MNRLPRIVTVTLHTAIDRVLEVPDFAVGEHVPARQIARQAAGKGINVSVALARLGVASIATGFVGHGEDAFFAQRLRDAIPGRAISQLLTVRGATRENITLLDPNRHTDTHLRTQGYTVTDRDVSRLAAKLGLLANPQAVVIFSGSLPEGMTLDQLRALVSLANGRGARVALDLAGSALRHIVGTDLGIARQKVWLIKPNRQELADAVGQPTLATPDALEDAGRTLAKGSTWVAVTQGSEGSSLVSEEGGWHAQTSMPSGAVVNTVGCGDCFLAGLVAALVQDQPPAEALGRANAVAAANACTREVCGFEKDQIQNLAQQTHVVAGE